jgi:hypothetical protein
MEILECFRNHFESSLLNISKAKSISNKICKGERNAHFVPNIFFVSLMILQAKNDFKITRKRQHEELLHVRTFVNLQI